PTAGPQESVVQTLPSSQASGGPPWHAPFEHVSRVVQAFPSSHAAVLGVMTQSPVAGSQESSVQTLPSSQCRGWPMHLPPPQPPCSKKQSAEQQSPLTRLPSSHSSPGSTTPLPQRAPTASPPLPSPNLAPVICARRKATMSSCNGESSASNACAAATASE